MLEPWSWAFGILSNQPERHTMNFSTAPKRATWIYKVRRERPFGPGGLDSSLEPGPHSRARRPNPHQRPS
jgi:hypothetical protein